MVTPPATAAASAVRIGETSSRSPIATPAKATWPMPSPIRLMPRCTTKKPTVGASRPITAPAAKARRMNSESNMDVGGVVPETREVGRRSVEDDRAAHEEEPLDVALDGAELVGDVDDGRPQLVVQAREQDGERLLRLHVDARRRLVEDEPPGLCGDHLADGGRRLGPEPGSLRQVAERLPSREGMGRFAEQHRAPFKRPLEAEQEPHERRLAAPVRAGDGDELAALNPEVDAVEDLGAGCVAEANRLERDGRRRLYVHPRAWRRA